MTREKFIKKWLGNKNYEYTEQNRDLMRNDFDKVITKEPVFMIGETRTINPFVFAKDLKKNIDEANAINIDLCQAIVNNFFIELINDEAVFIVERGYFDENLIYNKSDSATGLFETEYHTFITNINEWIEVALLTPAQFIKLVHIELDKMTHDTN